MSSLTFSVFCGASLARKARNFELDVGKVGSAREKSRGLQLDAGYSPHPILLSPQMRFLVTFWPKYAISTSVTYSTQQAAKKVGIHSVTLHRWLAAKKVRPTIAVPMDGGRTLWRWTEKDIAKLEKLKKATYRKGRGRKPKGKKKRLK